MILGCEKMLEKIKKIIINNYKWFICLICFILFLALAEDVFNHDIMKGDIIGYDFISTYMICNSVTPIEKIITWFGSPVCFISITIILFILIKNKKIVFLIYLVYCNVKNKYFKILLSLLIILIGISKIYLGVHYTSDVMAGFLISISYLIFYIKFADGIINN